MSTSVALLEEGRKARGAIVSVACECSGYSETAHHAEGHLVNNPGLISLTSDIR